MIQNRDDFSRDTKRVLAERVAWRCSFPDCNQITIGPNATDATKRINNGIAAHIHAAAKNGPRYREEMSPNERKHITNGIWMCRNHGNLIDADFENYSSETLLKWKYEAERLAAQALKCSKNQYIEDSSTLLQIGSSLIFNSHWKRVSPQKWEFNINSPVIGKIQDLRGYVSSFENMPSSDKFVVVESQGDARIITSIELRSDIEFGNTLSFSIKNKPKPTDPNLMGSDLALNNVGGIFSSNGDIALVDGLDAAIQKLSTCLSIKKGEMKYYERHGSLISHYYKQYNTDLRLMSKLFKLEIIRLSFIPLNDEVLNSFNIAPLHFVRRILNLTIRSNTLTNSRLNVELSLEWGNGRTWSGIIPIFVDS